MQYRHRDTLLLVSGIAGPILFGAVVVVTGALRSNYSHVNQFISELGESGSAFAWLMNYLGFMTSAVLMLVFVLSFRVRFPGTAVTRFGTVLLGLFAVCQFLAGVYSCDVGCPTANGTREQQLHDLFSMIAFPALILGVAIWGIYFCRVREWRRFGVYSLVSVGFALVLVMVMVQSEAARQGTGLYQRLFLGVLFLWLIALAIRLAVTGSQKPDSVMSS